MKTETNDRDGAGLELVNLAKVRSRRTHEKFPVAFTKVCEANPELYETWARPEEDEA